MDQARTAAGSSPKRVGKQLRALRRKKGLSLSEVARGTGLSRRELVAYERGKVAIPESDLWVLAGACGVDASELLPPVEAPALVAAPATIEDTITHLRSGQEDAVLNRHLNTLAALRALPPGSQVQLQDRERASMLETLGADPDTIEQRLVDRMRIAPDEAARLRELILPSAPRYSPLAVEAPVEAPAAAPAAAAIAAPAEPHDVPAADPWFGGAFSEQTPTGPVDVFQELACLAEPTPLAGPDAEAGAPEAVPEAVLVEVPAAAAAAVVHAADAPPIEVAARFDTDGWNGAPWGATASDGVATATSEPLATREPTPWEPPPSAWDAPWATTAAPVAPVDHSSPPPAGPSPLGIVEFVDDYVEPPDDADVEPPYAPTPDDGAPGTSSDLGPWDHEPDPAATSSGFYVDWGTGGAEGESASPWDPPATAPAPEALAPWPGVPAATRPEPEPDAWSQPEPDGWSQPEPNGWSRPEVDADVAPISWHPLDVTHPEPIGPALTSAVGVAPVVAPYAAAPPAEPEPIEEFVTAGSDWVLGNAVPLVEVRGQGSLVMRRADERWALADVTTTPDFALEVEVDFRSGPGFGVLFHASADDGGHMSGYSFDVDPIHEGGSYLIRQWQADRELWNPIARVAAVDPASMHGVLTIRIVVVDDTVDASVNGERVLAVESLKQACADRNREPATGDRVGVQAWSSSDLVIDTLRVAER